MREPILKEPNKTDINYCLAAWKEFTTLTHKEETNLKHILFSLKKSKEQIKELVPVGGRCKVFCKELNIQNFQHRQNIVKKGVAIIKKLNIPSIKILIFIDNSILNF